MFIRLCTEVESNPLPSLVTGGGVEVSPHCPERPLTEWGRQDLPNLGLYKNSCLSVSKQPTHSGRGAERIYQASVSTFYLTDLFSVP